MAHRLLALLALLANGLDDDCDGLTDASRRDFTDGRFALGRAQAATILTLYLLYGVVEMHR